MSGITPEQQIEALLEIVEELDPWTQKFVASLNEWVQDGRRLTARQRKVLEDKFSAYDPLWLQPRKRRGFMHPVSGKPVLIPDALAFLAGRLHALDAADARLVQKAIAMTADGGGVTDRAANRIKLMFTRALAPDQPAATIQPPAYPPTLSQLEGMIVQPTRGQPGGLSVTVLGPTPSAEISRMIEAAMAERATLKGRLH